MSKNKLLEDFEKHKGEFVITPSNKVEKLVALIDDGEDYYYVFYDGRFNLDVATCVARIIYLKGKIDDKDYNELIRIADINDINKLFSGDQKSELKRIFLERLSYDNSVLLSDDIYL